jgi:ParB-like chromosome segregation protein Spo0J
MVQAMKILGQKPLKIDQLILPGDMAERRKSRRVEELAGSIRDKVFLHPITVRRRDDGSLKLLAGGDRVAAHLELGLEKIDARLVECDALEETELTLTENLRRKHLPPDERNKLEEQLLELHTKREEERQAAEEAVLQEDPTYVPDSRPPKSPKALAREKVAATRGVKPESVRRQEARRKQKEEEEEERRKGDATVGDPPIETMGMRTHPSFQGQVRKVQKSFREALSKIRSVTATITYLTKSELPAPREQLRPIYAQLQEASHGLDRLVPTHLCPACKGVEPLVATCMTCEEAAFVGKGVMENCPPEGMDEDLKVLVDQRWIPLKDYLATVDGASSSLEETHVEYDEDTENVYEAEMPDEDHFEGDEFGA